MMDSAPAILAWRPYPPLDLPARLSQLGGLPLLESPAHWPRASDGKPLHFLARVDCADLPAARGPLPAEGLLQFFARIDENMVWDGDEADHARVLYGPATGVPTPPPPDLGAIMGGYDIWDKEMRLPEEPLRNLYLRWPLRFDEIRTWTENPDDPPPDYHVRLAEAQAVEVARVTGVAAVERPDVFWISREAQTWLLSGEGLLPPAWILCERIARRLAVAAAQARPDAEKTDAAFAAELQEIERQARGWIKRAHMAGLDAPVAPAAAQAFLEWLQQLARDPRMQMQHFWKQARALVRGVASAVVASGESPTLAARLPPAYYELVSRDHVNVRLLQGRILVHQHQMLGHRQSSQDVRPDGEEVLLLQLFSDYGVDFMFCDVGEIHFWIHRADLAARRFDRVRANTQGG